VKKVTHILTDRRGYNHRVKVSGLEFQLYNL
jgi:hypothetical protein